MGFDIKQWSNPITLDATNINRLEQGIKDAHDTLDITNREVANLQNKQGDLIKKFNNLNASSELKTTLETIHNLVNTTDIMEVLTNTSSIITKTPQSFTKEELNQVYRNLKLDTFLRLTDVKLNDTSIVSGSKVTIPVDNTLNLNSDNPISNKAVANALKNINLSGFSYKLADMIQDPNHLTVTAQEKALWNKGGSGGGDGSGGGLTIETDPTVPAWAKQKTKPLYDWEEILNKPTIPTDTGDLIKNSAGYLTTETTTALVDSLLESYNTSVVTPISSKVSNIETNLLVLQRNLDNKAETDHTHTSYAEYTHTHSKADITDFTHTHSKSDITDLYIQGNNTGQGIHYWKIAQLKTASEVGTGYSIASLLVSGVGDFGGSSLGTYLITMGTRSGTTMRVTELDTPTLIGSCAFGYITTDTSVDFYIKTTSYNFPIKIIELNNDNTIAVGNLATLTTDPGLTYVSVIKKANSSHTHNYLPKSGGTMTGNIIDGYRKFNIKDIDQYNAPTDNTKWCVADWFYDSNNLAIGVEHIAHHTNGNIEHQLDVRRAINNTNYYASIVVGMDSNGIGYAKCPSPSSKSSNSNDIATTAWVTNKLNSMSYPAVYKGTSSTRTANTTTVSTLRFASVSGSLYIWTS